MRNIYCQRTYLISASLAMITILTGCGGQGTSSSVPIISVNSTPTSQSSSSSSSSSGSSSSSSSGSVSVSGDSAISSPAPIPGDGLGSNVNYYIATNNCEPIVGLTITIKVTQDIIWSASTPGFTIQLNAYSPNNNNLIAGWQQFGFDIHPAGSATSFGDFLETWPAQSTINGISTNGSDLINLGSSLTTLPVNGVPAGSVISIFLGTDNNSKVTSAAFTIRDPNGVTHSDMISTVNNSLDHSLPESLQGPITNADLSPIVAFELNFVGAPGGKSSTLISGAGEISYTGTSALSASRKLPSCAANSNILTAETANSDYGTIPTTSAISLNQSFGVVN